MSTQQRCSEVSVCAARIAATALGLNVGAVLKPFDVNVRGTLPFLEQA